MDTLLSTIHEYLFIGISTLFIFQSFLLFARCRNNKARITLAILELFWGFIYIFNLFVLITKADYSEYPLLRSNALVIGSYCILFTHFFPIQILLPGWLNWKKALLLLSPIILLTVTYYGGMALLQETPENLKSYAMLGTSIGHFNVWFRFVILLCNLVYLGFILRWLYGYEKKYIKWKNENFSDQEYVDISWMRFYDYIVIGISIFYLGILFFGGQISVFCHSTFVAISFSFLFYKVLFYESPYPEDFFATKDNITIEDNAAGEDELGASPEIEKQKDQAFESKIPTYTEQLKLWMEEEKPYLFNDFKLTDVSRLLPLNRSYLSRVFNEGFGQNFSEVVRAYRINYSIEILKKNPTLPMYQIASLSGFRSDSTFIKAFKQVTKMTPSQYKVMDTKDLNIHPKV